ncbi:MAG TPA: RDD family protein [Coleofasciculaceae cyanobacterium]
MGLPLLKQHHSIWTPELVELSLPLAGIARRVLARLLDQLILVGVYLAIVFAGFVGLGALAKDLDPALAVGLLCACFVLVVLTDFLYYWGFHALTGGKTPGKMLLGIRVVTARGGRINGVTALIRSLFNFADMILFSGSISAIMLVATEQEKRIADFAAGTIVVMDRSV